VNDLSDQARHWGRVRETCLVQGFKCAIVAGDVNILVWNMSRAPRQTVTTSSGAKATPRLAVDKTANHQADAQQIDTRIGIVTQTLPIVLRISS